MTWFRVDDSFADHPKVEAAGNAAVGLVVRLGAWASRHLTDGFVPDSTLKKYGTRREIASASAFLTHGNHANPPDERATPGDYGPGVWLHDYLDRNPTRTQVLAEREAARLRQQRGRQSQGMSRRDIGGSHTVSNGGPDPTRPDPTLSTQVTTTTPVLVAEPLAAGADPYEATIELLVDVEQEREGNRITHVKPWRVKVRERIETELGPSLREALADGYTPAEIAAVSRDGTALIRRRDPEADAARSCVHGLVLTGSSPADAYAESITSYPRQHAAICAELGWEPNTKTATVTPITEAR